MVSASVTSDSMDGFGPCDITANHYAFATKSTGSGGYMKNDQGNKYIPSYDAAGVARLAVNMCATSYRSYHEDDNPENPLQCCHMEQRTGCQILILLCGGKKHCVQYPDEFGALYHPVDDIVGAYVGYPDATNWMTVNGPTQRPDENPFLIGDYGTRLVEVVVYSNGNDKWKCDPSVPVAEQTVTVIVTRLDEDAVCE